MLLPTGHPLLSSSTRLDWGVIFSNRVDLPFLQQQSIGIAMDSPQSFYLLFGDAFGVVSSPAGLSYSSGWWHTEVLQLALGLAMGVIRRIAQVVIFIVSHRDTTYGTTRLPNSFGCGS